LRKDLERGGGVDWFFRLRSTLYCEIEGQISWSYSEYGWDRIAHGLRYVDFNRECFNSEIFACMDVTYGGFSRTDLLTMPFDEYEQVLEETIILQKKIQEQRASING